ncbi:MAG TPA: ABC transporter permease [Bacteroidota bacterium]|nr:ABC transporter permease [Bacteroidota bacterium]
MFILHLIHKNLFRHKLRSLLTILGITIAVLAFGLMQTVVSAWNAGVAASAADRLIVVHSVSFIYPLPLSYKARIERLPGVETVSWANWFSGVYIDEAQFFARMAVDPATYFKVYPEFIVSDDALAGLAGQRNGTIIGALIAEKYNLKVGDIIPLEGDIYPGHWEMKVVGIYRGRDKGTDESQMLFNWEYLDQSLLQTQPARAGRVGWYVVDIRNAAERARISADIDSLFANSPAETKTQTEKEFQQSFVSMSSAILTAINIVSVVIIGIILLVLSNTMIMTARERFREFAVLKTLGFSTIHLAGLIGGESMVIAGLGSAIGIALTFPISDAAERGLPAGWFPVFNVELSTLAYAAGSAFVAGVAAAAVPVLKTLRMKIVDGLRQVG